MPAPRHCRLGFFTGVLSLLLVSVLLTTLHLHDVAVYDATAIGSQSSRTPIRLLAAELDVVDDESEAEDSISVLVPAEVEEATAAMLERSRPVLPSTYTGPTRRFGGDGCSFELCPSSWDDPDAPQVAWTPTVHTVAGRPSAALPHLYVVVPFRNRLDNLARLVSSINNSTTPQQRACTCIVIADFETRVSAVPSWKNRSCLATWDRRGVYLAEADTSSDARDITLEDIAAAMQPRACPVTMHRSPMDQDQDEGDESAEESMDPMTSALRSDVEGHGLAFINTEEFFIPLNVDVTGLRDPDPMRYVLGLFDGESAIVGEPSPLPLRWPTNAKIKLSPAELMLQMPKYL